MDSHHSDSEDSEASGRSIEQPPSVDRNLNLELKRSIEELKSQFYRSHQTLIDHIKKLNDITDKVESVHKNSTVGSLVGSSIGAVGGIAALAGVFLAPFTLGASLALTGAGAVAGVAGGVTGATSNITNVVKQNNLRETIEKIIDDFQNTVNPMIELLNNIYNIIEDTELIRQTVNEHEGQRAVRGVVDVLKIANVANVAQIGKTCAKAAKEIRVSVKAVQAIRGPAQAAKAARATAETAKSIRTSAALAGGLSALFLALDVYFIVQDSAELSEMNQPAEQRREEEIKSETLKFILHMRKTAAQFEKIVGKFKDAIDTFF